MIINKFDPSGAFMGDYVADVVMLPDPTNPSLPAVTFEVSIENGNAYVEYGDVSSYEDLGDPSPWGAISRNGGARFKKANFQRVCASCLNVGSRVLKNPRVRQASKCTNYTTAGAWTVCGLAALFTGGPAFIPCAASTFGGAVVTCTLIAIFGS